MSLLDSRFTESAELKKILRDVEFAPQDTKLNAIARLHDLKPPLHLIQSSLNDSLRSASRGSALSFFCAATLARFGDKSDWVREVLFDFIRKEPEFIDGEDDTIVEFPWMAHLDANFSEDFGKGFGAKGRVGLDFVQASSIFWTTIEALSHTRSEDVASFLTRFVPVCDSPQTRAFCLYALGALGVEDTREILRFYAERDETSPDSRAARISLDNFGRYSLVELARLDKESTDKKQDKCFIASAVYDDPKAEQLSILRRFRDERMRPRLIGRLMISVYEKVSPPVAARLKQHPMIRLTLRCYLLDPFVDFIAGE